jgi:hypothetical protein
LRVNNSSGPIIVNYNNSLRLSWRTSGTESCQASGDWSGSKNLSGSEEIKNLTVSKTYRLSCSGPGGSQEDEVKVEVLPLPTLFLDLKASLGDDDWQESLQALLPIEKVDLKLVVWGSVSGPINYRIDCDSDGVWEKEILKDSQTQKTIAAACGYKKLGVYNLKVKVERTGLVAEKTLPVSAFEVLEPDIEVLAIEKIFQKPLQLGDKITYIARVVNRGPAFEQKTVYYWYVDRIAQVRGVLPGLAVGQEKTLSFTTLFVGQSRLIQFQADAEGQLDEASETNNILSLNN